MHLPVAQAQPYSNQEIQAVETATEKKIRELRNEEIKQLRIALGRRLAKNRRADLYFRLAEVYLDGYRSMFLLEGRAHSRRLDQGKNSKLQRNQSIPFLRDGIRACQEIIDLKIDYPKMDRVLYFLAFNYGELGQKDQSLRYYKLLTSRHPNSVFAVEAFRELGFSAFDRDQFKDAIAYFEQALRLKQIENAAEVKPMILYRLAWSYYRTRQTQLGIETMKKAVESASQDDERFLSIREEALRDMAIFMTEKGQVEDAIKYFATVAGGKSYYPRTLEKLGDQYRRRGDVEKAIQVYESLLQTHPSSEVAFSAKVKLVDLDIRSQQYVRALKRVRPQDFPDDDDEKLGPSLLELRSRIRRVATEKHEAYRKRKKQDDLKIANLYYSTYLKWFLSDRDPKKEKPEIQMYLAEVKGDLKDPQGASELYKEVLESGDSRYAKEAGTYWVASLSDAIGKNRNQGDSPSDQERQFVDAADRVVKSVPNTLEARESALRAAQVLAGYSKTREEAEERLEKIVERWPDSKQGLVAAELWLQIRKDALPDPKKSSVSAYKDQSDKVTKLIIRFGQEKELMAADAKINRKRLHLQMSGITQETTVGLVTAYEYNRDFDAAAREYLDIAQKSSQAKLSEAAFENAIGAYAKAGSFSKMEDTLKLWERRYPKSRSLIDSKRNVATVFLIEGKFAESAEIFEQLGEQGDSSAWELSARIYQGIDRHKSAQTIWNNYLKRLSKSSKKYEVALWLAQSYELMGNDREAAQGYQLCMKGSLKLFAECGSLLGDLHERLKDSSSAREAYKRVAQVGAKGSNSRQSAYFGYAWYRLSEATEESQKFPPLSLADNQAFQKQLTQRTQFFQTLSRAYNQVVSQGGPWAVAALHRQALWTMGFAQDVDNIQPQKAIEGQELKRFRSTLAAISNPLRKEALDTWKKAYMRASQGEILSPALPAIADALSDYRQKSPRRAQGHSGGFRVSGLDPQGDEKGKDASLQSIRKKLRENVKDSNAWVDYGNLLWGEDRLSLSKVAYQRALDLNSKNHFALNNWGVVLLSEKTGQDSWVSAAEAAELFDRSLKIDKFYLAAKLNKATLLNYYRLFSHAKPMLEQVLTKQQSGDIYDGLGVALQGLGSLSGAKEQFEQAEKKGASSSRFVRVFHEAAQAADEGSKGSSRCLSWIKKLNEDRLKGFERESAMRLKRICEQWSEK